MTPRAQFRVLWFGQFASVAGLTVVVPLMPFFLAGIGAAPGDVPLWTGVSLAAPAVAQVVSAPLWGALGDRWGRKSMVVRAHLGLAVAVALMAVASSPAQFLGARVLQGLFGGVVAATAAHAGSLVGPSRDGRTLGGLFSATAAGSLLGPLLGGLLTGRFGFSTLFLVVAALLAVAAVLAVVVLRESGHGDGGPRTTTSLREVAARLARSPAARGLLLAGLCGQAAVYALVVVFAPAVARVTGSTSAAIVWVGVLQAVTWAASAVAAPWWGRRHDRLPVARGFALAAVGCAIAALVQGVPMPPELLLPVRVLQGCCFAALLPAVLTLTARSVPARERGAATGFATGALDLGQVIGPLIGALSALLLPPPAVFAVVAVLFLSGALLAAVAARGEQPAADTPLPDTPEVRR